MDIQKKFKSKTLKILLGLVLLLVVPVIAAPFFIDSEKLKNEFVASVEKSSGMKVKIKSASGVGTFPTPSFSVDGLEIIDEESKRAVLTAAYAKIEISWVDIFTGTKTKKVTMSEPKITLINSEGNKNNLQNMVGKLRSANLEMALINATINIQNPSQATIIKAEKTNGNIALVSSGINATISGRVANTDATLEVKSGSETDSPITISLSNSVGDSASFSGKILPDGNEAKGTLSLKIIDANSLIRTSSANAPQKSQEEKTFPISATGEAVISESYLWLSRSEAMINNVKGTLAANIAFAEIPTIAAEAEVDKFDLTSISEILNEALKKQQGQTFQDISTKETMNVVFIGKAKEVVIGTKQYKNFSGQIEYGGLDVTLRNVSIEMDGDSAFTFDGRYTSRTLGARIEGKGMLKGNSFKTLLAAYEPSAAALPQDDFGVFSIDGNLFLSKEQFRLSEANVNLGEIGFTGGLATYFQNSPKTEAEVRFKGANLDYFRNVWRKAREGSNESFKLTKLSGKEFSWLKNISGSFDFTVWLDGFTFLEKQGTSGALRLLAKNNELSLTGLQLQLPEGNILSTATINTTGEKPHITLAISTPFFNSEYFSYNKGSVSRKWIDGNNKNERFSPELFDFSWLAEFNSAFDININSMTIDDVNYGFFKAKGSMANQTLNFQSLGFNAFGGQFSATGSLTGGKVPAISANFALYNTDIEKLLEPFAIKTKVTGLANISGIAKTSGLSFVEWVKQAKINTTITARGVQIFGFNLQGIVDATNSSRTTADVVKGVAELMPSGTTTFSVDGNINLENGIIQTPVLKLESGTQTNGILSGQLELFPWRLNVNAKFQFPQLSRMNIPTFGLNLAGPIDEYTMRTDTASLESYVAKRIVGQ